MGSGLDLVLPRRSLAGSELLATANTIKGWSLPLLPDHVELTASEQAQRYAARARRGGKLIRWALDKTTHRWLPRCRRASPLWTSCFRGALPLRSLP